MLHSSRVGAELLLWSADGAWLDRADEIDSGEFVLTSIGFKVSLAELYARTGLAI